MKQKSIKYAIFNTVSTCEIFYIPNVDNFAWSITTDEC